VTMSYICSAEGKEKLSTEATVAVFVGVGEAGQVQPGKHTSCTYHSNTVSIMS